MKDFDSYLTDDTRYVHCDVCDRKFDLDEMTEYEDDFTGYMCPSCYEDYLLEKESEEDEEDV